MADDLSGKQDNVFDALRIDVLLERAALKGASDVHLAVGEPPAIRLDGQLHVLPEEPLETSEMNRFVDKLLGERPDGPSTNGGHRPSTGALRSALESLGSIDVAYALPGVAGFRVNVYRQKGRLALAARRIPAEVPTIGALGLPGVLKTLSRLPDGLVLVTGPTGSGKSTTLAAMIEEVNANEARHIITLEDPIEYVYVNRRSLIRQREIGRDAAGYAQGLRAALRQDPDVILVGEMRDLETIATALTAAETGHFVLSTLHTQDAPTTIDRIIDVFPGEQQNQVRLQLAAVLRAVVAQRLIPKRGGGRMAILEILINTPAVANLIRQKKTHQLRSVMQSGAAFGMQTFERAARELRERGVVDPEALAPFFRREAAEHV